MLNQRLFGHTSPETRPEKNANSLLHYRPVHIAIPNVCRRSTAAQWVVDLLCRHLSNNHARHFRIKAAHALAATIKIPGLNTWPLTKSNTAPINVRGLPHTTCVGGFSRLNYMQKKRGGRRMDPSLLVSIYQGASSIATPLSLSALISSLFFLIVRQIIDGLKDALSRSLPEQAVAIVLRIITYFFVLSLAALIGGIGCYAATFLLKDYVERQRRIDAAQEGVTGGDLNKILANADQLISANPHDPIGYKFRGVGMFMKGSFLDSTDAFSAGIKLFPEREDVCGDALNAFKGNLAAAQGAAGLPKEGLETLREIEKCRPRPKMDAFNRAKMLLALGKLDDATDALKAPELNGPDRPDIRSRVALEKALVAVAKNDADWGKKARAELVLAIGTDANLKQILCFKDGQADPGWSKLEDFGLEQSIINKPENRKFFDALRNEKLDGCQ